MMVSSFRDKLLWARYYGILKLCRLVDDSLKIRIKHKKISEKPNLKN